MNCPNCISKTLKHVTINSIQLDICTEGCQGIWFDQFELKKFDEPHESLGGAVESAPLVQSKTPRAQQLNCPKCKTIVMLKRFSSVKKKVEIDECGKCAGVWLEAGELNQLRDEFKSEEDRRNAAEKTFNEMFDASLVAVQKQSAESSQNAKRIANAFRFISPSYYIPGKQKWGAF
jgi:uncharacterized protein